MKSIFLFISSLFIVASCAQVTAQENLTVEELHKKNLTNKAVILDVRTAREYATGKIAGSINLDVLKTDLFTTSIEKLDKTKVYYVICRSGSRSQKAQKQMIDAGFNRVYNVAGGMQAWEQSQFPME